MTERTLKEIAAWLGGSVSGDPETRITGLGGLLDAVPGDLTFVVSTQYARYLPETRASAIVIAPEFGDVALPAIRVATPERAFEKLIEWFRPERVRPAAGIDPRAAIAADARIGDGAAIGPFVTVAAGASVGARTIVHSSAYIGPAAEVGDDCEIHANVTIGARVRVGSRVIVHGNAVIGADGFGFRPGPRGLEKLEHIGTVVLGDDVEIGAGTTIDRARFGRTSIGRGTKIDNLCQIAHNVRIGEHCVVAAQSGVSGSTIIGDRCMLGGQVGTVGHIRIGDGCMIAARSGISKDTPSGSVVYGFVAAPHLAKKREDAALRHLPELLKRVRELERSSGIGETRGSQGPPDRVDESRGGGATSR